MSSNGYIIRSTLNESSTTTVHTAFHPALNRTVLLKILHKHLVADKDFADRFVREARACAQLRSEHIVQVYDLTEIDGAPAIVMEYVDGPSLKTIVDEQGPRPYEFVRRTALHILRALRIAHAQNIVHRDIKPGNILLAPSDILKVTDFGLATIPQSPTITSEGAILGTPAYMSPEQIHGEPLDARTDLFSLGVTLVEMINGKRLFDGTSYAECIKKIMLFKGDVSMPDAIGVPPDFHRFLERLLAPDIGNRYSTAEEALAALGDRAPVQVSTAERPAVSLSRWRIPVALLLTAATIGAFILLRPHPANLSPAASGADTSGTYHQITTVQSADVTAQKEPADENPADQPAKEHKDPASPSGAMTSVPAAIADADSGFIRAVSTPWAKVYVDNQYAGVTPLARPLRVKAGMCVVTFNNPSFSPIVKTLTVRGNEELLVQADFMAASGFLSVQAVPWAEVFVDDQYCETTPLKPILLSAGSHRVRLHNPAFSDIVKDVLIAVHDTARISIVFSQGNPK